MSNPAKPFVLQHAVPKGVTATRWWWVRHAPVRDDGGCIYGQKDMTCDTSDREVSQAGWDAAGGGIGRAASRRMAGAQPRRVLCEPAGRGRQLLVRADRRPRTG